MKRPAFFATLILLSASTVLWSCSSAQVKVMPGTYGVNRSVVLDKDRRGAESAAVIAANDFCVGHGKSVVYLRDATYTVARSGSPRDYRSEVVFRCD